MGRRWSIWLRNRLRDWLGPSDEHIRALARLVAMEQYQWNAQGREQRIERRMKELEEVAAQVTLAVSDVIAEIQLARRHWEAVVASQEADKEEKDE